MSGLTKDKKKYANGLVMGKFMPPHLGHEYLIQTALENCNKLTIFVYSFPEHPIDGEVRASWMRELFPEARVIHIEDFIPIYSQSDSRYWKMWAAQIRKNHPEQIHVLFSSEDYGNRLAEELGAKHICVDKKRYTYTISATEIRENPARHMHFISSVARSYFRANQEPELERTDKTLQKV